MTMMEQIRARRVQIGRTAQALAELTGLSRPNLSAILSRNSRTDVRGSTLEALAGSLDAEWVLMPKHMMPEVRRSITTACIRNSRRLTTSCA
jgi:transcriptional regulator with XRE-family HTH domain